MGHVAAFASFAQAIALDGFGQDDCWCALVFHSGFKCGVHFFGIVTSATQFLELFVREMFDHFEQVGMGTKKVAADVFAGFDGVFLVLTIDDFFHAFLKQTLGVFFEKCVPIVSPYNFDDIPASAAKDLFEFLNDLAIAAHGTVEALQVAVDHKDEVVELFAGCQTNGAEGFGFVCFAIANEDPDFGIASRFEAAVFEVAVEAGLVDAHEWAKSH